MSKQTLTIDQLPKRMKDGEMLAIPHFYGCMGEVRTVIAKPKLFKKYSSINGRGFRFVVGPDLYIHDAVMAMLTGNATHKTKHNIRGHTVYFYKNYRPAIEYFKRLFYERVETNHRLAAEHKEAQRKANSSDPQEQAEGAAKLLDF